MFWSDEGGEAGEIDDLARLRIAGGSGGCGIARDRGRREAEGPPRRRCGVDDASRLWWGGGAVWMGASVVARARERRYVRVGGGTIADDVVSLGRDLADQPGAAILRTSRAPRSRRGSQLDLLGDGDVVAGDQWRPGVGCGGIVNLGKLLDPTGELT